MWSLWYAPVSRQIFLAQFHLLSPNTVLDVQCGFYYSLEHASSENERLNTRCLQHFKHVPGCGDLVVRSRLWGRRVPGSKLDSTEDSPLGMEYVSPPTWIKSHSGGNICHLICKNVDSYIEEVEKCMQAFKAQLQEQHKELQEDEGKVINLLSAFYKKDSPKQNPDCTDQMTISFPNRSSISSLFKDDSTESFIFKLGQEDKRQHLAAERRAEYNSFIEKDKELLSRRKILEESRSVTPRSILESVDYEKILAKRKEEESKFRNLNYAEPSIDKKISKSEISVKENVDLSLENPITSFPEPPVPQPAPIPMHRTGGGGEPVRDSSGNLITNRRFKASSSSSEYFPFQEDNSKHKKDYYREELRKQIQEKKRLKELEEERARLLEEQVAQRIEQQRRQMQMEYEKELQKNNLLKEQRQQERLKQLEEFQKRDAAMKNKRTREIQMPDRRDSIDLNVVQEPPKRSASPPVPSVRSKVILERVVSPDVTIKTQALSGVKPENIFSSLAEIRRTIMQEQNNAKKDLKESYEVMNRRTVVDDSDDLPF
ncbi:hypothetical protein AVEN_200792-2 [Araneus ventricosus]|uniref:Centrosome and spindle pole-associated protein 1 n=1 Tax=Araneus ventricosus TaxID=182803 RepID=A0A4Y2DW39_ARAVE|nr:hypothetical protein AVEN_200792-2 [Araneus ventricosus]